MRVLLVWRSGLLALALAGLAPVAVRSQAPPPAAEETGAASATLDQLVREALQSNPAVQSALRRVEALRRRVPQARSLPDPVLSVGWMGDAKPFGVQREDPSSYRAVSAVQEIPFPGKLRLRADMADREAQAAMWDYEEVRRRVVADVKAAYYDYFYYNRALDITFKDQELLEKLTRIAETRYQVGQGLQQDVLKAQVELSRLQQRLTVLEQQQRIARARLNTLLARDPDVPLAVPATLEAAPLPYSLDSLYQLARENDTGLQREQKLIERSQVAVNLARREYYPDLAVGYTYQNRPLLPEMHGLTFSVRIPVFYRTKQREGVAEATQSLLGAQRDRDDRWTTVAFEVKQQYLLAKASEELFQLYSRAIVPQSSLALESSLASYQVGKIDFLTLMESFATVLDYELEYYRELANYQIALARLEPLVGVELTGERIGAP